MTRLERYLDYIISGWQLISFGVCLIGAVLLGVPFFVIGWLYKKIFGKMYGDK